MGGDGTVEEGGARRGGARGKIPSLSQRLRRVALGLWISSRLLGELYRCS